MDRSQIAEDGPSTGGLGVDAVDGIDPEHAPVLFRFARGANRTGDPIADPEAEAPNLAGADVDVIRAGQQAVPSHEPEPLVDDVEDPAGVIVARTLGLGLQDHVDEDVLALAGRRVHFQVTRDLLELGDAHLAQIADLEVIALARGLEFLLLLELADGRDPGVHGGAASGSSVTGALVALVWAWSGHMGRSHLWARGRSRWPVGRGTESRAWRADCRCVGAVRDDRSIDRAAGGRQCMWSSAAREHRPCAGRSSMYVVVKIGGGGSGARRRLSRSELGLGRWGGSGARRRLSGQACPCACGASLSACWAIVLPICRTPRIWAHFRRLHA